MTPDLTAAIARIRELLALATAAPWRSMEEDVDIHTGEYEEPYVCAEPLPDGRIQSICTIRIGLPGTLANAEFIALARNTMPDLLAELGRVKDCDLVLSEISQFFGQRIHAEDFQGAVSLPQLFAAYVETLEAELARYRSLDAQLGEREFHGDTIIEIDEDGITHPNVRLVREGGILKLKKPTDGLTLDLGEGKLTKED